MMMQAWEMFLHLNLIKVVYSTTLYLNGERPHTVVHMIYMFTNPWTWQHIKNYFEARNNT